jgi:hypothetical protein
MRVETLQIFRYDRDLARRHQKQLKRGYPSTQRPRSGSVRGAPEQSHCENAVKRKALHLVRDSSQRAFSGDISGNSYDISNGYFGKHIGGSSPLWSASKSLILQEKPMTAKLCPDFRMLAAEVARVGHCESEFRAHCTLNVGCFSERDFASGFLCH